MGAEEDANENERGWKSDDWSGLYGRMAKTRVKRLCYGMKLKAWGRMHG